MVEGEGGKAEEEGLEKTGVESVHLIPHSNCSSFPPPSSPLSPLPPTIF